MAQKKIFVVDDSEIVLAMATAALESAGYQVIPMERWEQLNEALQKEKPDLIVIDINMPEMTGDYVLMFFKEERGITDVPILLYSDIDVGELEQRAKDCGANGFASKSWGVERLVEVVGKHMGATS